MKEVARRAGVSPATVSRVLNKTHYIAEETERRVLEVVGQMKYFKNVHARRLSTGQSDLFGLVISEISSLAHGIEDLTFSSVTLNTTRSRRKPSCGRSSRATCAE